MAEVNGVSNYFSSLKEKNLGKRGKEGGLLKCSVSELSIRKAAFIMQSANLLNGCLGIKATFKFTRVLSHGGGGKSL